MGLAPNELPKIRPICLLNEIEKIFERILTSHMKAMMDSGPELNLSDHQYGFRTRRSTCDALRFVVNNICAATENGSYAVAVSLDIRNAFNSIPWIHIRQALEQRGFPNYLRRILDDYLHKKSKIYEARWFLDLLPDANRSPAGFYPRTASMEHRVRRYPQICNDFWL